MHRTSTSVLSTATPVNLRFSTSQATQAPSGDRHSTVHIGSIRIHGTQLLLVSSNRFDSGRRNRQKHSAVRFQSATEFGENKSFAGAYSRSLLNDHNLRQFIRKALNLKMKWAPPEL